jgi:hypothetical protein
VGEEYLKAGQPDEAAAFFHRAGDTKRLEDLASTAKGEGDYFTFLHVRNLLKRPLEAKELKEVAARAREAGKESFAARAEEAALKMEEGSS